jgi:hypothetical protein
MCFLGYNFADYKCLDPITNNIYLSTHIIFDETTFSIKDTTSSQLPSKINATGDSLFFISLHIPLITTTSPSNNSTSVSIHVPIVSVSTAIDNPLA